MRNRHRYLTKLAAVVLSLAVVCTAPCAALAAEANADVQQAANGVVQVVVYYLNNDNDPWIGFTGTGFLVNDDTVISCDHVLQLSDAFVQLGMETFGKTASEIKNRRTIQITVLRDVKIAATVTTESAEMDFSILHLSQKLHDRTYLKMRSSADVQQTEAVYALGFPSEVEGVQNVQTYTSDDVNITAGQVNKLTTGDPFEEGVTADYIQHSVKTTGGNSGGPLVDAKGNVVGIIRGATGDGMDWNYGYAIASDQIIKTMDSLGIEYATAGEPALTDTEGAQSGAGEAVPSAEPIPAETQAPQPTTDKSALSAAVTAAQALEIADYEEASGSVFSSALEYAQSVLANERAEQPQIDEAVSRLTSAQGGLKPKAGGISLTTILLAAAGAVIVLAAIIVIVALNKKKAKKEKDISRASTAGASGYSQAAGAPTARSYPTPAQGVTSGLPAGRTSVTTPAPGTTVLASGQGKTTVLGAGAKQTTVLNQKLGSLTRTRTGENVPISGAEFVIGREASKVNYCVADNSSVGRTHAKLSGRAGSVYATDMNSTNGTLLNGAKLPSGQETLLHDGDKLTLADEEFVYHVQ